MWRYPRPEYWQQFEQILADWAQEQLGDPSADRYGRSGQRQDGIDILARNRRTSGGGGRVELWAIQAKKYDETPLTPAAAQAELDRAMTHSPRPDVFVLATSTPRDTKLQAWAAEPKHPIRVEVWFWDGLVERLLKETWFRRKYIAEQWFRRIPHEIPAAVADFTGRELELADLAHRFESGGSVVVLSGMGGVGKTELALAVAQRAAGECVDGELRVDLCGTDPAHGLSTHEIMSQLVRSLDPLAPSAGSYEEIVAAYRSTLWGRRVTILLDNVYDAAQVEPLLPLPDARIVITSRQRFILPGAHSHEVLGLSQAASAKLLSRVCRRATRIAVEMAQLCGGLPLALRLAATALAERVDLTSAEYLEWLRDERTRREFVEATACLSYRLLTGQAQTVWRTLATFRNPFDSCAAAAVAGQERSTMATHLGILLRHSLLDWDATIRRYRIHELLRIFGDSLRSEEDRASAERRFVLHYQSLLTSMKEQFRLGGTSSEEALRRFDADAAHFFAAGAWLRPGSNEDLATAAMWSVFLDAGVDIFPLRVEPQLLRIWLSEAVDGAHRRREVGIARVHAGNLALVLRDLGEAADAEATQRKCLEESRMSGDLDGITRALGNLAVLALDRGEADRAIELASESAEMERRLDNQKGLAADYNTLANAYRQKGERDRALALFAASLKMKAEIGDIRGRAVTTVGIAQLFMDSNDFERALSLLSQAVFVFRRLGDHRTEDAARNVLCSAWLGYGVGRMLTMEEFTESAEPENCDNVQEVVRRIIPSLRAKADLVVGENAVVAAAMLGDIGGMCEAVGDTAQAIQCYNRSIARARLCGEQRILANGHYNKAIALAGVGRLAQGVAELHVARRLYAKLGLEDVSDVDTMLDYIAKTAPAARSREAPSPGRRRSARPRANDACACGSGKKYKRCCMLRDRQR
ncbi:MAG: NB-ARC domain-containing protein [Patescibacteria group bacterium]|nr:NB-ARC domain-containing protein [Patescibacteria group bacterium]